MSLQTLLPLFKLTGRHNYAKLVFNELADLQVRWPRQQALTAVAHLCVANGGGPGGDMLRWCIE